MHAWQSRQAFDDGIVSDQEVAVAKPISQPEQESSDAPHQARVSKHQLTCRLPCVICSNQLGAQCLNFPLQCYVQVGGNLQAAIPAFWSPEIRATPAWRSQRTPKDDKGA